MNVMEIRPQVYYCAEVKPFDVNRTQRTYADCMCTRNYHIHREDRCLHMLTHTHTHTHTHAQMVAHILRTVTSLAESITEIVLTHCHYTGPLSTLPRPERVA